MNFNTALLIGFLVIFTILVFINRKKFKIYYFAKVFYFGMLRTNVGLKTIDRIGSGLRGILTRISPVMIIIGFLGMIIVAVNLIYELFKIFAGQTAQSVGLVLPVEGKGIFFVPFIYWILAVIIVMIVHEGGHGIMARSWKIPVRKTGIAFLGAIIPIIPAAFVEPDEKKLAKTTTKKQLSVFAAGPFANIIFGFFIYLILIFALNPVTDGFYTNQGVEVIDVTADSPAFFAGLNTGEIVKNINGQKIIHTEDFTYAFKPAEVGDVYSITTDKKQYSVTLAENPSTKKRWLGAFVQEKLVILQPTFWKDVLIWIKELFFWVFLLNLGVGLFNLVPLGPIDGGKMLQIGLSRIMPKTANKIWKTVGFIMLLVILGNIIPALL